MGDLAPLALRLPVTVPHGDVVAVLLMVWGSVMVVVDVVEALDVAQAVEVAQAVVEAVTVFIALPDTVLVGEEDNEGDPVVDAVLEEEMEAGRVFVPVAAPLAAGDAEVVELGVALTDEDGDAVKLAGPRSARATAPELSSPTPASRLTCAPQRAAWMA